MRETHAPPQSTDPAPGKVRMTAIHRKIDGQDQIVIVCEGCDSIHTITVEEAMRVAMNEYGKMHESQHDERSRFGL